MADAKDATASVAETTGLHTRGRKSGFDKPSDYFGSLKNTPKLLAKRAFFVRSPEEQIADKEAAVGDMRKVLNWFHVMALGTGMIVGAGIFVSTGAAAKNLAGPAVIISFLVAGISALLSALCYSEFAAEFPLAGGAYNYISMSLGEFAAWLIVTTLILEYILAGAAVSRAFSAYFATLIGKPTDFFTFPYKSYSVDFLAAGLVIACCCLLIFTTAGGSWFNILMTGSQIVVIIIILAAGFSKGKVSNMQPFLPYGAGGIFSGASFVFFSFIGFDCVSTLAEEVKNPAVDMPVGIVGCISFVTIVYCAMALCIVMMVPYHQIDEKASFATAFTQVGLPWGQYLVGLGATLGIVTGVLVNCMGVSRIVCSLARTHLFFPLFGEVNGKTGTPIYATLFVLTATLPLAILTDLPPLIDMVSAGTLMVFGVVSVALIWKRVYNRDLTFKQQQKPFLLILTMVLASIAFACVFALATGIGKSVGMAVCAAAVLVPCILLHFTCHQHNRPAYRVPFFPYTPAASLLLNCFLMASLPAQAYWQLGLFFGVVSIFYVLYSIHAGTAWENKQGRGVLATTVPQAHRPESLRVGSSFRENPSVIMPYRAPSHLSPMQGRWSGGVTRLPAEF